MVDIFHGSENHHGQNRNLKVADEVSPANGATATIPAGEEVVLINPDGTNAVDPDNAAEEGALLLIVHNGGTSTPTLSFADADFVGSGPANMTTAGESNLIFNVDGTTSGWVVLA